MQELHDHFRRNTRVKAVKLTKRVGPTPHVALRLTLRNDVELSHARAVARAHGFEFHDYSCAPGSLIHPPGTTPNSATYYVALDLKSNRDNTGSITNKISVHSRTGSLNTIQKEKLKKMVDAIILG